MSRPSIKCCTACIAAVITALGAGAPADAETIATFTRNPPNPILRGVRIGSDIAAGVVPIGAMVVFGYYLTPCFTR